MSKPDFTNLLDLAAEKLGGKTLMCSDDFFAPMENLIKPGRGIFIEDKYTDNGKGTRYIDFDVREYPAGGKSGAVKPAISVKTIAFSLF